MLAKNRSEKRDGSTPSLGIARKRGACARAGRTEHDELAADDAVFTFDVGEPTIWAARSRRRSRTPARRSSTW